jgi:polysaccharide export outer membrane protein
MNSGVKASQEAERDHSAEASSKADGPQTDSAKSAPGASGDALGDYRLAPGDRLTVVVFDEPQLSGDFFVDGGGEVLLPLAGSVRVSGLTLAGAQELIQKQFANGVLVQPAISVRIKEYRPIFVTGDVKRPGSYRFMFGESVKAAIAAAGGEGSAVEKPLTVAATDFISAEARVRQLEADHVSLLVRKARLEAQRDDRDNFVMPLLVGLDLRNVNFERVYSAENDAFLRLSQTYYGQLQNLRKQRPRIEAEVKAVAAQIAAQNERLNIVNGRLADLEPLFKKGFLRKEALLNQQMEKTLVQTQLSNLEAQVARLQQSVGELDFKQGEVKAAYERQVVGELQETLQRLRAIETTLGPARKLRDVRAEEASGVSGEEDYDVSISRVQEGRLAVLEATNETVLSPGDVVEVKLKRRDPTSMELPSIEAARNLGLSPASLADGSISTSR